MWSPIFLSMTFFSPPTPGCWRGHDCPSVPCIPTSPCVEVANPNVENIREGLCVQGQRSCKYSLNLCLFSFLLPSHLCDTIRSVDWHGSQFSHSFMWMTVRSPSYRFGRKEEDCSVLSLVLQSVSTKLWGFACLLAINNIINTLLPV